MDASKVPVYKRLPEVIRSSQAYKNKFIQFHIYGTRIDESSFDEYYNDWDELLPFIDTNRFLLKTIVIDGEGIQNDRLPSSVNLLLNSCDELIECNLQNIVTDKITDVSLMFYGCNKLEKINLSEFDVHNVVDFDGIFGGCKAITNETIKRIEGWNVSNAKEMSGMFSDTTFTDLDISSWSAPNCFDLSGFASNTMNTSWDLSNFGCSIPNPTSSSVYSVEGLSYSFRDTRSSFVDLSGITVADNVLWYIAFQNAYWTTLRMGQPTLQEIGPQSRVNALAELQVPSNLVDAYKAHSVWGLLGDKIVAIY